MEAVAASHERRARASAAGAAAHDAGPGPGDRLAWRDAALVWLAQRVLLFALVYIARAFVLPRPAGSPWPSLGELYRVWVSWDGAIYGTIARSGYTLPQQAAFFPLYPLLERALAFLAGGDTTLVGPIISNAAALAAFGLLRVLAEREWGRAVARRTLVLLAIFPVSLYFAAAYTESLFLLLSVAAFLALRRGRWVTAGLFAALATLTRPVGILLLVPLAVECWRWLRAAGSMPDRRTLARMAAGFALPPLALLSFFAYLSWRFGSLAASLGAQASGWGRHLAWPWAGFARAGSAVLHEGNYALRIHAALDIGFTLLFIALALATVRRLPLAYVLYACATLALVVLTPMQRAGWDWAALSSNARFMLVVFPLFALLAQWAERRRLQAVIVALSLALLILLTFEWAGGAFVA